MHGTPGSFLLLNPRFVRGNDFLRWKSSDAAEADLSPGEREIECVPQQRSNQLPAGRTCFMGIFAAAKSETFSRLGKASQQPCIRVVVALSTSGKSLLSGVLRIFRLFRVAVPCLSKKHLIRGNISNSKWWLRHSKMAFPGRRCERGYTWYIAILGGQKVRTSLLAP